MENFTEKQLIELASECYMEVGHGGDAGGIVQLLDYRHNLTQEERDFVWEYMTYHFDPHS